MGTVIFHPDIYIHKTENDYTNHIYQLIEEDYSVKSLEWFIKHPFCKDISVLYLNWLENMVGPHKVIVQKIQYSLKLMLLRFAKSRGIKICYAIHNRTPHSLSNDSIIYQKAVKPFLSKALAISDKIIVLNHHSFQYLQNEFAVNDENKLCYIRHGKYERFAVSSEQVRKDYHIRENELVFSYVGRMNRYKNIDIVIDAFYQGDIQGKLLLVGKCDEAYQQELRAKIEDDRVICDFSFVSDERLSQIMQSADVMILPYENTSMNSGVMINAFSNGTTVISNAIEMLLDFPKELCFGYHYASREEHVQVLSEKMTEAYACYPDGQLKNYGDQLYKLMCEEYSWDKVKEDLRAALE